MKLGISLLPGQLGSDKVLVGLSLVSFSGGQTMFGGTE